MRFLFRHMVIAVGMTAVLGGAVAAHADTVDYLKPAPLSSVPAIASTKLAPVQSGTLNIPTITWPGDVPTVLTQDTGIFKSEGLDTKLFLDNDFAEQVQGVVAGKTPFLRGTFGMINAAAETLKQKGTELVVLNQLTWSDGGDALVVRPGIKSLADLKGKTIALQLYGPHMDLLTTVLARAGLKPSDVKIVYLKELTIPTYETHGKIVDTRSAFAADSSIDAAFVISPDAAALTSNGAKDGGSGAEGSVKGAKVLFSTKSANRVIADVYAVRKDWFDANRDQAQHFVHAMMLGQESFDKLMAGKSTRQTEWTQLMQSSATLLFGSAQATSDVEGSLGDCQWVGFQGNVAFFTATGTTRNFNVLKQEIQDAFVQIKVMTGSAPVDNATWDYNALAAGLTNVDLTAVPKAQFDAKKAQSTIENQIASEPATWGEDGTLLLFEINFKPKQSVFDPAEYADAFKKALDLSQTFGGAIIVIEGHNAPDFLNKARAEGRSATEIAMIEQAAKNLSLQRAQAVRRAYLDYCKSHGIQVDESQFVAVGMGATHPKFATPANAQEWAANMRAVFRVKTVETESDSFQPSK